MGSFNKTVEIKCDLEILRNDLIVRISWRRSTRLEMISNQNLLSDQSTVRDTIRIDRWLQNSV